MFNAYGAYQMLQAVPGQILTLTWPRTAEPDGTVADGSSQVNVYYNPNATINAGTVAHYSHTLQLVFAVDCVILEHWNHISLTHAFKFVHMILAQDVSCPCVATSTVSTDLLLQHKAIAQVIVSNTRLPCHQMCQGRRYTRVMTGLCVSQAPTTTAALTPV